MRTHPILLVAVGLTLAACDDSPSPGGPSTDGTLVISTSTGGTYPDEDGYLLTVDGVDSLPLDPAGTSPIDLPAGQHTLRLTGMAEQCSVSPPTPIDVAVASRDTTSVAFEFSCSATGVRITTTTTGMGIDPDGYRVAVDGEDRGPIPPNDTMLIPVNPGSRTIALTGLTSNCAVAGSGSRAVTIVDGEVTLVAFAIVCVATTEMLAYTGRDGDVHVINVDGTNLRNLTTDGRANSDWYATWSPIGDRIAFTRIRDSTDHLEEIHVEEIHVINADGTNLVRLSPPGVLDYELTWSPDGHRIAFVHKARDRMTPQQIYVMTADGANRVRLSTPGAWDLEPTWSPDGERIAFVHFDRRGRVGQIYVMRADGTNRVRLTSRSGGAWWPTWSPDGRRIAFLADGPDGRARINDNILVMDADGTHQSALTNGSAGDTYPTWSPDGRRIVFSRKGSLFVMNADGTSQTPLTSRPQTRWSYQDFEPQWSPKGDAVVFTRSYDCDPFNDSGGPPCVPNELWTIQVTGTASVSSLVTQGDAASWRP